MLTARPPGIVIDLKNPSGRALPLTYRPRGSDESARATGDEPAQGRAIWPFRFDHQWSVEWYANESALRSTLSPRSCRT